MSSMTQVLVALAVVAVVALIAYFALRKAPSKVVAPPAEAPTLPAPAPKVALAPSETEEAKRRELEEAKSRAEATRQERLAVSDESQARALKEKEEEARREAYRAQKALEAEEKDRKRRERDLSEQLLLEEKAKAAEAAAAQARAAKEAEEAAVAAQSGRTLADGLARTRKEGFIAKLNGFFGGAPRVFDDAVLGELEEILFTADIGVRTATSLLETARSSARKNELGSADKVKDLLRAEVQRIVNLTASHSMSGGGPPHVIMVVGVNGAGKTTTIGKLAAKAKAQGKKVVLAAGDTFRAAATEQLDVWAERAGAELVTGKEDSDPAAVVFEAVKRAKDIGADLVIADTAGRLHTKAPLMEELKKVKRVLEKALPGAPHEVLLVLDGNTGQNAIAQAKQFQEAVGVTSIAITKLDGTAKGGVIIGICDELKIPVAWVGVGEKVSDLRPFTPKEFVDGLFDSD